MDLGIASKDSEELAYYEMIKIKIEYDKKKSNMGIPRTD
tara:strand:+ start:547 stop:663 length:117 start_codon:yes stop_codon:yes gene_type:complete